jgi:NAD(P)-dependent dehydrogenase (short-subunit alcohol dehydrogenase family)
MTVAPTFNGKSAIVTGATKGIGRACAELLIDKGYRVLICSRNGEEARRLSTELARHDDQVCGVEADLGAPDVGTMLADECLAAFGQIDVLVNNAGVFTPTPSTAVTAANWDETLHANLRGTALVAGAVIPVMAPHGGCSIVNLSSINGLAAEATFAAYNASKAGVVSLTQTLAIECASKGIRVNCVAPGWIRTPMTQEWIGNIAQADVDRMIPMGRVGNPGEIAEVVWFLTSDAASYITGQTIVADAGMLIRQPVL